MKDMNEIDKKIEEIEALMSSADFWSDKDKAQASIKELKSLKDEKEGLGVYDKGKALVTILSGAGGDDAEDFSRMLFEMYQKFSNAKGFSVSILESNPNTQNGFRNISFSVVGKKAFGLLKNENGVHRLVRLSPFNSKNLRQTSFSLVEVIPHIEASEMPELKESDIRIEFSKTGGPGGQNVNKRETGVRITHIPTGVVVSVREERSQEQNKERAFEILRGKLFLKAEKEQKNIIESMQISKNTDIEWGNQIRNYVLHPYKLVKDLRSGYESTNPDKVFEGDLDGLIEAMDNL